MRRITFNYEYCIKGITKMTSKPTWNDLHEASQHELRKTYKYGYGKIGDRHLENSVRRHLDGANAKERREFYDRFYRRK
jgi:hypothetical protein